MSKNFFIFLTILSLSFCSEFHTFIKFLKFKIQYDKKYPTVQEALKRYNIFKQNLLDLKELQKTAKHSVGITQFSDQTKKELSKPLFDPTEHFKNTATYKAPELKTFPASLDWNEKGLVTDIQNQGACGSCFIFSAIGVFEGAIKKKRGTLIKLSEKHVLDCISWPDPCNTGGLFTPVQMFVEDSKKLYREDAYGIKYNAKVESEKCMYPEDGYVDLSDFEAKSLWGIFSIEPDEIKQMLYDIGPINCYVNSDGLNLHSYRNGIIQTGDTGLFGNHAVLLTGYGEENGVKYWIFKNSWGKYWGEKGFFRVEIGKNLGACEHWFKGVVVNN